MKKSEFEKPLFIASHFGFAPIDAPRVSQKDIDITEDCGPTAAEKAAFLRVYVERNMGAQPHPLALSWKRGKDYSLELVGFPAGVAEAKLIRAALSILTEEGHKNLVVEVNSIGDKDSIVAYERELHAFVRKSHGTMSPELKKLIKDDIFTLVKAHGEEVDALKKDLPQSIASLSAASRGEFKEVLAYLEALGVDFRFAPELVGEKNMCSETLFNIRDEANTLLASGFHYSRLSKRFGFKKELPLMGVTIFGDALKPPSKHTKNSLDRNFTLFSSAEKLR
jgi:histidyl-tRNA synthetase